MAVGPGLPPGVAPTRLVPAAPDEPIGTTDDGKWVRMTMYFAQWAERLRTYIGQPGTNNPPGVSVSDQLGSLNVSTGIMPFEPPAGSLAQRVAQLEDAFTQVATPVAHIAPPDYGIPLQRVPLPVSFGGTGLTASPTDGQLLIGDSLTRAFDLNTLTAGAGMVITNGHGTISLAARTGFRLQAQWVCGAVVQSGTVYFAWDPPYAGTINSMTYFTGAGTFTVAVQINSVNVTGLSAVVVNSSTPATTNATAANTFTAGQHVTGVISAVASGPVQALLSLNCTWTT